MLSAQILHTERSNTIPPLACSDLGPNKLKTVPEELGSLTELRYL